MPRKNGSATAAPPTTTKVAVWRQGSRSYAQAEAVWLQDGLAVTPADLNVKRPMWVVTHVQSGYAASRPFKRKEHAIELARQLLWLADWTIARTRLMADKELVEVAQAVITRHHGAEDARFTSRNGRR